MRTIDAKDDYLRRLFPTAQGRGRVPTFLSDTLMQLVHPGGEKWAVIEFEEGFWDAYGRDINPPDRASIVANAATQVQHLPDATYPMAHVVKAPLSIIDP